MRFVPDLCEAQRGGVVPRCTDRSETRRPILTWRDGGIYLFDALILHHVDNLLLMLSSTARQATLSAGFTRFLAAPFVSSSFHVRRSATHAGNLTLLEPVHRRKPAILFAHMSSPDAFNAFN
jgi:hypothetical protein